MSSKAYTFVFTVFLILVLPFTSFSQDYVDKHDALLIMKSELQNSTMESKEMPTGFLNPTLEWFASMLMKNNDVSSAIDEFEDYMETNFSEENLKIDPKMGSKKQQYQNVLSHVKKMLKKD